MSTVHKQVTRCVACAQLHERCEKCRCSETEGSIIEPMKLLKELPSSIPQLVKLSPLPADKMEKLASSFGTLEKANAAIQEYLSLPR
jgi:hypothetical protein